ncbi:hypothetical protein [Brevundimonas sp.]|uniref:hypothetical protein n=1 Tax=Brevundimonas sp. TaxID=1871086 RepID=UPI0028A1CF2D|nr:hypothetical protein [Brevundimonas sp.]
MPTPLNVRVNFKHFLLWLRRTLDKLCERPDHLQRLSIIGSGLIMWPTLIGFALVVWLGYGKTEALQAQSLNFLGMALLASMALWALVVIALLGIIKGFSVSGPGGVGVSITTTADDPDVAPATTRVDVVAPLSQSQPSNVQLQPTD